MVLPLLRCAALGAACLGVVTTGCGGHAPAGGPLEVQRVLGEAGSQPGQMSYPRCMVSDGQSLWVIDRLARVQRLDPRTGDALRVFRTPKFDNGKPAGLGVFVGTDGERNGPLLLVGDTHEHRVLIYAPGPAAPADPVEGDAPVMLGSFGAFGTEPGQFVYVTDVAALPTADGTGIARLYVGEYGGNDRVTIVAVEPPLTATSAPGSSTFRVVKTFGTFGSGSGPDVQFNRPQGLVVDAARGEVLISDACNHRIGRFTLEGELIAWTGGPGSVGEGPGSLRYPYGIELLPDGTVLVAELGNNRVQRLRLATRDEPGASLGILGQGGRGKGHLAAPWAVVTLGSETFVLDSGNNRVQVIATPRGMRELALGSGEASGAGAGGAR